LITGSLIFCGGEYMLLSGHLRNHVETVKVPATTKSSGRSSFRPFPVRLVLVIVIITAIIATARLTGAKHYFTTENVSAFVQNAGMWGYLLFIVIFTIGEMLHVFGLIFVAAGVYAFGQARGLMLGLLGGVTAVSVSFLFMRAIGGMAFTRINRPWVQKMLQSLDRRPIRTVFVLRLFLIMHPSLNYLLALTHIRFRDYFIGSVVGLIIPISLFVIFFHWLISYLPYMRWLW
jgi:uncharacterized membrane protein YdjX (TVP38/TMEM64 family)